MNQDINQWDNFHPGQKDYDYMMQKKDIYNQIVASFYIIYTSSFLKRI